MTDFVDGLEQDLVDAARRQATSRRAAAGIRRARLPGRGLALALGAMLVAGSAAAAVVGLNAEPSKPLTGPVSDAKLSVRAYAISLLPDLRAGEAGWCGLMRVTSSGRFFGAGMGCGPARGAGAAQIVGGGVYGKGEAIEYTVVTSNVAAVRFDKRTTVATRTDPTLPYGWRYAVAVVPSGTLPAPAPPAGSDAVASPPTPGRDLTAPVALDAAGHELPATTHADDHSRGAGSRAVTRAEPARRCVIGRAPGYIAGYARVALGTPRVPPRTEGRAFAACAVTVFHTHAPRSGLKAAILLDAHRPSELAAALPRTPGLSGRRLGPGWLVVYGASASRRADLLSRLTSHL